jgi:hypothetical protein
LGKSFDRSALARNGFLHDRLDLLTMDNGCAEPSGGNFATLAIAASQ